MEKRKNSRPAEKCFFLTPPLIELIKSLANLILAARPDYQEYTARTRREYVATSESNRSPDLEWSCPTVSPMDGPCDSAATFHCGICGQRFCDVHAEDETRHACTLATTVEGARFSWLRQPKASNADDPSGCRPANRTCPAVRLTWSWSYNSRKRGINYS
jgi:hypothetical protein